MKRKSASADQEGDAAHNKRVRIGGLDWGDVQAESGWHQLLTADTRTHVLRNLDVISLVAMSCASKRDCAGTRALRGEYYVDGKRIPRLAGRDYTSFVAHSRIYHEGYLREIWIKPSFYPTDVFRTLLRWASEPTRTTRDECLAYAEWFGQHFPPMQSADWDEFVRYRVLEGADDVLEDLLNRFYSPTSSHSIAPRLLLSRNALPAWLRLERWGNRAKIAYHLVRGYIDSLAATDKELRERDPYALALRTQ